jgi:opacity protein-like surface antigen
MTSIKTFTALAAGAVVLSTAAASQAQTPYYPAPSGQTQPYGQSQPSGQDIFGQILRNLFGGQTTGSVDSEWSRGRRALGDQQSTFNSRLDAEVRSGGLRQYSADRLRADYDALVQLEARYGQDGRFTTQERQDLTSRYNTLTEALQQGGYHDGLGNTPSIADGRRDFDARVNAAVRARTLTRSEGNRLRADYAALVQTEAGYQRDGLTSRERQDLETRLNALDARVGDAGYGGGWQQDPRTRLTAIERALYGLPRTEQDRLRVQLDDLTRLESAYARLNASAEERAYIDRRLGELELEARVRR